MHWICALAAAGVTALAGAVLWRRLPALLAVAAASPELAVPAWRCVPLGVAACGLAGLGAGWSVLLPAYLWLALAATALIVVDVAEQRLPNRIVFPTYAAGLLLLALASLIRHDWPAYARGLLAMAALYAIFLVLTLLVPSALGFGDVKLAGVLGLYLGYLGGGVLAVGLTAGILLGALAAVALLALRRVGWRGELAYGPALLAGALLAVAAGQRIWAAYTAAAGLG